MFFFFFLIMGLTHTLYAPHVAVTRVRSRTWHLEAVILQPDPGTHKFVD